MSAAATCLMHLRSDAVFSAYFDLSNNALREWDYERIEALYNVLVVGETRILFYVKYCTSACRINTFVEKVQVDSIDAAVASLQGPVGTPDQPGIVLYAVMTEAQYGRFRVAEEQVKRQCRKANEKIQGMVDGLQDIGVPVVRLDRK
jgi:hypothetical protein